MTPEELALQAINKLVGQPPLNYTPAQQQPEINYTPVPDNQIGGLSWPFGAENINNKPAFGGATTQDLANAQAQIDAENALNQQAALQLANQNIQAGQEVLFNNGIENAQTPEYDGVGSVYQSKAPVQPTPFNPVPVPLEFDKLDLSPKQSLQDSKPIEKDLTDEAIYKKQSAEDAIAAFNEKILQKQLEETDVQFQTVWGKERALFTDGTTISNAGDIGTIAETFPEYQMKGEEYSNVDFIWPVIKGVKEVVNLLPGGWELPDLWFDTSKASNIIAGFVTSIGNRLGDTVVNDTTRGLIDQDTRKQIASELWNESKIGLNFNPTASKQLEQAGITSSPEAVAKGIYGDPAVEEEWTSQNPDVPFSQAPLDVQARRFGTANIDKFFATTKLPYVEAKKRLETDRANMTPQEYAEITAGLDGKINEITAEQLKYKTEFSTFQDWLTDRQKYVTQVVADAYKRQDIRTGIIAQNSIENTSSFDKFVQTSKNLTALQSRDGELIGNYKNNPLLKEVYDNGKGNVTLQEINNEFAKINIKYDEQKKRVSGKLDNPTEQKEFLVAVQKTQDMEKAFMTDKILFRAIAESRKAKAGEQINQTDLEQESQDLAVRKFVQERGIDPNSLTWQERETYFKGEMGKYIAPIYESKYDKGEIGRADGNAAYVFSPSQMLINMNNNLNSKNAIDKFELFNPVSVYKTLNTLAAGYGSKNFDFTRGLRTLTNSSISAEMGLNYSSPEKSYYDYKQNWHESLLDDTKVFASTYSNEMASTAIALAPFFFGGNIATGLERVEYALTKAAKISKVGSRLLDGTTTLGRIWEGVSAFNSTIGREILVNGIQDVVLTSMLGKNGIEYTDQDAILDLGASLLGGLITGWVRTVKRVNNIARLEGSEWLKLVEERAEWKGIKLYTVDDKIEAMDFYNNIVKQFNNSPEKEIATALERNKLLWERKTKVGLWETDIRTYTNSFRNASNNNFVLDADELKKIDEKSRLATDYTKVATDTAYQDWPGKYLIQLPGKWDNRVKINELWDWTRIDIGMAQSLWNTISISDYDKLGETGKSFYRKQGDVYIQPPRDIMKVADIMKQDIDSIEKLTQAKSAIKELVPDLDDEILDNYLLASKEISGTLC